MRNKDYIDRQLETADQAISTLIYDVDANRPYVDKEYLLERLQSVKKSLTLALDRLQLEDENS